jgi:hypothetical protein
MSIFLKELAVVLVLSAAVFSIAKSTALRFMDARNFTLRRNLWFALSVAAYLSPNYWIFLLLAGLITFWGGRKDSNPIGLYLLLMTVVPAVSYHVPTFGLGINELFSLDIFRLLSLCVLVPAAWRLHKSSDAERMKCLRATDYCIIAFGVLHVVLFIKPEVANAETLHNSPTNAVRNAFLFFIDSYVIYYVASRTCNSLRAITDAMAAFWLSSSILATIAIFESTRHWLLYAELLWKWNIAAANWDYYILRAGALRAQASAGDPLALGFLLAIALGFWCYLQYSERRKLTLFAAPLLLCLGLLASYSRGPWIGAAVIYFVFAAIGPRATSRLSKALLVVLSFGVLISMTPWATRLADTLPFTSHEVDTYNITYREVLLDRSWQLIKSHPLFGDQNAYADLKDLRQGQGIVDLVNSYAEIALGYGSVGLVLFLLTIALPAVNAHRCYKDILTQEPELATLGRSLLATTAGLLVMISGNSFTQAIPATFFALVGILAAYSLIAKPRAPCDERRLHSVTLARMK